MTSLAALQRLHKIQRTVLEIGQQLDQLELKEKQTMLNPIVAAKIQELDTATTAVATRMQAFVDQAANQGSMSAQEVADALSPEIARLTAMGKDPDASQGPVGQPTA